MPERPDQWYWDALDRKHAQDGRILITLYLLKWGMMIVALVCFVVVAVKL